MTSPSVPYLSFSEAAKQVWWYPVVRGVIAVALGAVVMANPTASVVFLVRLLGVFVIVDGVVAVVDGVRQRGVEGGGSTWRLVTGVLGLVVGAVLLFWPGATVGVLTIIVGIWAVVGGVLAALAAFGIRSVPGSGWQWGLFWGLVTVVFGLVLMFAPDKSVAVLAWIIGLYAVLSGVILVIAGFVVRSLGKQAAAQGY